MTLAWYGHLKFGEMKGFHKLGMISIILISWGIASVSYTHLTLPTSDLV